LNLNLVDEKLNGKERKKYWHFGKVSIGKNCNRICQNCVAGWLLLMSFQNTLPLSEPMFAGITQH